MAARSLRWLPSGLSACADSLGVDMAVFKVVSLRLPIRGTYEPDADRSVDECGEPRFRKINAGGSVSDGAVLRIQGLGKPVELDWAEH